MEMIGNYRNITPKEQKLNIKLINTVQKYRSLYDHTLKQHNNREEQESAWRLVGEEMQLKPQVCKLKWRCIRQAFLRHLRLEPGPRPRRPYYLSKHLDFIKPYLKIGRAKSKELPEVSEDEGVGSLDSYGFEFNNLVNVDQLDLQNLAEDNNFQCLPMDDLVREIRTRDDADQASYIDDSITPQPSADLTETLDSDDSDEYFFKSLLPEVRLMTVEQKLHFKSIILGAIANILYPKPNQNLLTT